MLTKLLEKFALNKNVSALVAMPLAMLPSTRNYVESLVCAYTENQLQFVIRTKSLTNPNFIQFGILLSHITANGMEPQKFVVQIAYIVACRL